MKIVICGSMKLAKEMISVKNELEKKGYDVDVPLFTEEYARMVSLNDVHKESAKNKIDHDLIRDYYQKIKASDGVLILNHPLNGIENYIGGNSFLEIAFAHVLNKKIFLMNPIPQMGYTDELVAMQPIVLNGDLSKMQ